VWLVDLGMTAKVRPALVLSVPAATTDRALATLVPHRTSTRGSEFEAAVPVPFLRAGVPEEDVGVEDSASSALEPPQDLLRHWRVKVVRHRELPGAEAERSRTGVDGGDGP